MADPRERAAERVMKLLRTAADPSASENERSVAALHAAELLSEHELSVIANEPDEARKNREREEKRAMVREEIRRQTDTMRAEARARAPAPFDPYDYSSAPSSYRAPSMEDWHEVAAPTTCACTACGRTIRAGDPAWYAEGRGHIHHDISCSTHR